MSAKKLLVSEPIHLGGKRPWRVALYMPTARYTKFRIAYKRPVIETDPDSAWTWRAYAADTEDEARELFRETVAAIQSSKPAPLTQRQRRSSTFTDLADAYLAHSKLTVEERTAEGRECIVRVHLLPVLGQLTVVQWTPEKSREVIARSQVVRKVGNRRLEAIDGAMVAIRNLAWETSTMRMAQDPLRGVKLPKVDELHGAGKGYVLPALRPERHHVDAMATMGDTLGPEWRMPLMGVKVRVGGYGGLRIGEQHALRPWDLEFKGAEILPDGSLKVWGHVEINGAWVQPRAKDAPARPRSGEEPEDPPGATPASVMTALFHRCRELLGLPENASLSSVNAAIRKERKRRGREVGDPARWWAAQVPPEDEKWIFVDESTGLPPRSELHNRIWHKALRALAQAAPELEWPDAVPYRNLRHFAAAGWWHVDLGRDWSEIALFLGDDLKTVLAQYIRAGADALDDTTELLRDC